MIITPENNYEELKKWLESQKRVFLVCGRSAERFEGLNTVLAQIPVPIVRFSDYEPNPAYESVVKGVRVFRQENCDGIMAVGGGSAMDVAKCIKLYAGLPGNGENGEWLNQKSKPDEKTKKALDSSDERSSGEISFLAMPTTAGSGSEATRFAVIYYNGIKQSITSDSLLPDAVLLDPEVLRSLPDYQRKATMMDALCHAIESYWSVYSTDESKEYAQKAIRGVLDNMDGYLSNDEAGNAGMLMAAHMAGKAINITKTTAGHAMAYKITGLFGCAHGHAVALCIRKLFPWMTQNIERCIDQRGEAYLRRVLDEIGVMLGGTDAISGAGKFDEIFESLSLDIPKADERSLKELVRCVNPDRLKNHPVMLDEGKIYGLYKEIL